MSEQVPETIQWKQDYLALERDICSFLEKRQVHPKLAASLQDARCYLMDIVMNCMDDEE